MAKRTAKKKSRKRATGAKKSKAKRTASTRNRTAKSIGTAELQAELQRRQRAVAVLERKHARLLDQLASLEREIATYGGTSRLRTGGRKSGGKRPRNEDNLADSLAAVLNGMQLSVTEAAEAVQAAGYRTTAANFRTIVNQTLLRDTRFKKVSRGVYTAK